MIIILIFISSLIYYSPLILNPSLILTRGNDLTEFFYPIFTYLKNQFSSFGQLPLWSTFQLSGTPLISDPQNPYIYLPNLLSLVLPLDLFFSLSIFLHIFLAGLGAYFCAKLGFKFSQSPSFVVAILYLSQPRLAGYIEAGHFGLIISYAWIPFSVLAVLKLFSKPHKGWLILYAASLSMIYLTHNLTFLITLISTFGIYLYQVITQFNKTYLVKYILIYTLSIVTLVGLVSFALFPQLDWIKETNRSLLTSSPDVYPKWEGKREVILTYIWPFSFLTNKFWNIDSEKWIIIGIFPTILAFFGYLRLKSKLKVVLLITGLLIILISLNNVSPIYKWLISWDFYDLLRVSTRVWIIPVFICVFLIGFLIQNLHTRHKSITTILIILIIIETTFLSWMRLYKPIPKPQNSPPPEFYTFLQKDKDLYRIFCTTRCIPQIEAAKRNLELVEGYNTLIQKNYNQQAWTLTGSFWEYYTLSIPPLGVIHDLSSKPNSQALGEYNTKYIISPYPIEDSNLKLVQEFNQYKVYLNSLFQPRVYTSDNQETNVNDYSPNHIKVSLKDPTQNRLTLASVYSKGWKAYINGQIKTPILEKPNGLMLVDLDSASQYVEFKYQPDSFNLGKYLTLTTILLILFGLTLTKNKYLRSKFKSLRSS